MAWWRKLLLAAVASLIAQAAVAREQILNYQSDIQVLADSSMLVTEIIRVRAEGDQIRRGIYRDFPTDYRDRWNNRVNVGFTVETVTRDGISESFFTEKYANGVRLYLGSENRLLPTGDYEYAISYRVTRQLGYFHDHDELYWNVTGNGWAFAIQNAGARIKLPPGVAQSALAIEGYTGAFGAKGQDYTARAEGDSVAVINATRPLQPGEGLTVVVSWPKGVVAEPTATDRAGYLLADNRGLIIALTGLVLMAGYLLYVWSRFGRDPAVGPVFPHYVPPPNLSPGACRYILGMAHDHQVFSAAVLSLAVKRHITIHEGRTEALEAATGGSPFDKALDKLSPFQKDLLGPLLDIAETVLEKGYDKTFVLEKNDDVANLVKPGPGEKALLEKLFGASKYLVLTNANHKQIRAAIQAHENALEKYYKRVHFLSNGGLLLPGVLIGVVTVMLALATAELAPLTVIVLALEVPLMILFAYLLKAPTVAGRKIMDRIEGFKMYLGVAEADDLQRLEKIAGPSPIKTPDLYERYLPYAVAFDIAQPWADQFEELFRKISAEEGKSYQPVWYDGSRTTHSLNSFTSSMAASLAGAISSSSTAPGSSSGSGGGGSSGGGGGGGGGGGW